MLNFAMLPKIKQAELAGMVARAPCRVHRDIEGLRGRLSEAGRQVEGLFQGLLNQAFGG